MYVFDFNYHRSVKKTLYRSPLHNKYMFVYNIERYFMYSIYKKEPKWHNKTPKWHTKNREHVWERYYFLYDFFKERILLVFVHNNLGKTGVLFRRRRRRRRGRRWGRRRRRDMIRRKEEEG